MSRVHRPTYAGRGGVFGRRVESSGQGGERGGTQKKGGEGKKEASSDLRKDIRLRGTNVEQSKSITTGTYVPELCCTGKTSAEKGGGLLGTSETQRENPSEKTRPLQGGGR